MTIMRIFLFKVDYILPHLGTGVSDADITARITLLSKLTGKELVEFSTEDTIGNKLSLFADLGGHFCGGCLKSCKEKILTTKSIQMISITLLSW